MARTSQSLCPKCNALGYKTIASRPLGTNPSTSEYPFLLRSGVKPKRQRRRECTNCGHRESTVEVNAKELELILRRAKGAERALWQIKSAFTEALSGD